MKKSTLATHSNQPRLFSIVAGDLKANRTIAAPGFDLGIFTAIDWPLSTTEFKSDLLLIDVVLPKSDLLTAIGLAKRRVQGVKILVVTADEEPEEVFRALGAGIDGYLWKSDPNPSIPEAIAEIFQGGAPMSRSVGRIVTQYFRTQMSDEKTSGIFLLTGRQRQVLQLVCQGYSNPEIGRLLGVSAEAVKKQVHCILLKLQVENRAEASAVFARHSH